MRNPWPNDPRLPRGPAAALAALHLTDPRTDLLAQLNEREWAATLKFCDYSRITLALPETASIPAEIRERLKRNAARNLERIAATEELYREVAGLLDNAGIEFILLKGLSHNALFGLRREIRMQYDIDLFCPAEPIHRAHEALIATGYVPAEGMEKFPTDHLPALVRPKRWEWHGDFFDPALPTAIELHFQFWSERMERLRAPGVEEFWTRRTTRPIAGIELGMLSPPDALAYACLHALRHILRGSAQPFHIYEIACMLEAGAADLSLHSPELRRLETIVFRMAHEWFGCTRLETEPLPAPVEAWFAEFATSPAAVPFDSNKDELWLHASLLESRRDLWAVARRRLLPANLPARPAAGTGPANMNRWTAFAGYAIGRFFHHAASLPKTASSGTRWWWKTNNLRRQFWTFLLSAVIFNFALFIFVLLYNLYLVDLGFREDFLGVVNGAARMGSLAGTLPAAWVAHRFGLRNAFVASISAVAADTALRAIFTGRAPLVALAFISGLVFALWAVVMAPLIAGMVKEDRRPTAFGVFFATMFATGIGANWLGGRLPVWLHGKQTALLWSAALSAVAIVPALRLKAMPMAREGARIYPRSRFLVLFLIPFAIWHLATGAFNPLNNVYFARLKFSVEQIGNIFSMSQLVQVAAVLTAPLVLRRAGLVGGIVLMMAATALSLAGLAAQPPAAVAVAAYSAYMAFQWMSEPGLNALLMNQVAERERSGAASLNYLVAFSAQAASAFAAGALVTRAGYGVVLAGATVLALLAAVLFQLLLRSRGEPAPDTARS